MRGGLRPGGERGRPKGSKNKFTLPTKSKMHDAFLNHDFDFLKEWVQLFREVPIDLKVKMIIASTEFIFPRRKPEDASGDASEAPLIGVQVSDEQLGKLVEIAREKE